MTDQPVPIPRDLVRGDILVCNHGETIRFKEYDAEGDVFTSNTSDWLNTWRPDGRSWSDSETRWIVVVNRREQMQDFANRCVVSPEWKATLNDIIERLERRKAAIKKREEASEAMLFALKDVAASGLIECVCGESPCCGSCTITIVRNAIKLAEGET